MAEQVQGDQSGSKPPPTTEQSVDDAEYDHESTLADKRRVRYIDDEELPNYRSDVEFGSPLARQRSGGSFYSIHSARSIRSQSRVLDPAVALPVQYRTLSFNVSHNQEVSRKKLKDKTHNSVQGKQS